MVARKKVREVLFVIDNMEHFQEKISIENKKLVCKWSIIDISLQLWFCCRHRCSLELVRALWLYGAKLQVALYEVRRGLCSHGVLLCYRREDTRRSSFWALVRHPDLQASFPYLLRRREKRRNRWRRLHSLGTIHCQAHPDSRWLSIATMSVYPKNYFRYHFVWR